MAQLAVVGPCPVSISAESSGAVKTAPFRLISTVDAVVTIFRPWHRAGLEADDHEPVPAHAFDLQPIEAVVFPAQIGVCECPTGLVSFTSPAKATKTKRLRRSANTRQSTRRSSVVGMQGRRMPLRERRQDRSSKHPLRLRRRFRTAGIFYDHLHL